MSCRVKVYLILLLYKAVYFVFLKLHYQAMKIEKPLIVTYLITKVNNHISN